MSHDPAALVRAFYADLWNRRDALRLQELLHDEFEFRGSLGDACRGPVAFWDYVQSVHASLADYRCEELALVADGRAAFARMRFVGRHVGALRGFSGTGDEVSWEGAAHFRVEDGRLASAWVLGDLASLEARLEENRRASEGLHALPEGLPVPVDLGGADGLHGRALPGVTLFSTRDEMVRLDRLKRAVLFLYPRTGLPGRSPGEGWDAIPGARGCTPQACGFRDLHAEFEALGVRVFGLSTQTTEYQRAFAERNGTPYGFLSDSDLALTEALSLPTFEFDLRPVGGGGPNRLLERMAWFVDEGKIVKVWYPVFPPDECAERVLAWLKAQGHVTR